MDRRAFLAAASALGIFSSSPAAIVHRDLVNAECGGNKSQREDASTCVIAVGPVEVTVVRKIFGGLHFPGVRLITVDSEPSELQCLPNEHYISLGNLAVMSTTKNAAERLAREQRQAIGQRIAGAALVVIIAGLDNAIGSGRAQLFAEAARWSGALTICLTISDSDWRYAPQQSSATKAMASLKRTAHVVVPITVPMIGNRRLETVAIANVVLVVEPAVSALCRTAMWPALSHVDLLDRCYAPMPPFWPSNVAIGMGAGSGKDAINQAVTEALESVHVTGAARYLVILRGALNQVGLDAFDSALLEQDGYSASQSSLVLNLLKAGSSPDCIWASVIADNIVHAAMHRVDHQIGSAEQFNTTIM